MNPFDLIEDDNIPEDLLILMASTQMTVLHKGGSVVFDTEKIFQKAMERLRKEK